MGNVGSEGFCAHPLDFEGFEMWNSESEGFHTREYSGILIGGYFFTVSKCYFFVEGTNRNPKNYIKKVRNTSDAWGSIFYNLPKVV